MARRWEDSAGIHPADPIRCGSGQLEVPVVREQIWQPRLDWVISAHGCRLRQELVEEICQESRVVQNWRASSRLECLAHRLSLSEARGTERFTDGGWVGWQKGSGTSLTYAYAEGGGRQVVGRW